ncbi:20929_t:CDS:2 [Rhizophagus irregularis]|nr:20929_t:CDS:2 [Rhizophagus irregularis]
MIGPEFAEKRHPEAIYTSRPLSALISKCSSIYSSSTISFDKQDSNYISEELELDIDIKSLSQNLSSTIQNLDSSYISTELELDINTERSQNLSSAIQNFSTSLEKRRNVEFLNVEPHDNSGKRIKTNLNYP